MRAGISILTVTLNMGIEVIIIQSHVNIRYFIDLDYSLDPTEVNRSFATHLSGAKILSLEFIGILGLQLSLGIQVPKLSFSSFSIWFILQLIHCSQE